MATIIINRKSAFSGSVQSHNVYLMNTLVGMLKNGGTLSIPVDVGTHTLSFISTMKKLGKNAIFHVVVNEPNEIVELQTRFTFTGEYEVQYADNRPHIPLATQTEFTAQPQNGISLNNTNTPGLHCPRCGGCNVLPVSESETTGKDFDAGNACCGFLLCGPLGLLCGAAGKGKQTVTTTYWMCRDCGNKFKS